MHWNNKLKLVCRIIWNRWFISLLLIIISIFSFYMIDNVITDYFEQDYSNSITTSMFGVDPYQVCYIGYMNLLDSKENTELLKQYISESNGVSGCGYFSYQTTNQCIGDEYVSALVIDQSIVRLGNLGLTDEQLEDIDTNHYGYQPVYVGYEYKDGLEVGDTFSFYGDSADDCIVVGYLQKNASWPKRGDLFNAYTNNDTITLNNSIVIVADQYSYFDNSGGMPWEIYFITDQPQDLELNQRIIQKAAELSCNIKIVNEGNIIEAEADENNLYDNKTFTAAVLLVILAVISLSASSTLFCLLQKKQYGIMIVCGLSTRELIQMVFFENTCLILISAVVVWLYRQWTLIGRYDFGEQSAIGFELLAIPLSVAHEYYVPIVFVICAVIMIIISGALPAFLIHHMSLNDLLSKKE